VDVLYIHILMKKNVSPLKMTISSFPVVFLCKSSSNIYKSIVNSP